MSETDHTDAPEGGDPIVAGEYVLGVPDASERNAACARARAAPRHAWPAGWTAELRGGDRLRRQPAARAGLAADRQPEVHGTVADPDRRAGAAALAASDRTEPARAHHGAAQSG